jgi:hypothetical protein
MTAVIKKGQLFSIIIDEPAVPADRVPPLLTRLSLVVRLSDGLLDDGYLEPVRMRLEPEVRTPILNLSGEFCFLDVPAGTYSLIVEAAHYFTQSLQVTIPMPNPASPLQTVVLEPRPSYPFTSGATMIRGIVRETPNIPVASAAVQVPGTGPVAQTNNRGEFVLVWPALLPAQVITQRRNGVVFRLVRNDQGTTEIPVEISHPDYQTTTIQIPELQEGTTHNLGIVTVTP